VTGDRVVLGRSAEADALLVALAQARRRHRLAQAQLRQLLAYGREFARPRPYRLADLAGAAGMSVSGVRTAYSSADVAVVAQRIGRSPCGRGVPPAGGVRADGA
jgi:hypothetical protein